MTSFGIPEHTPFGRFLRVVTSSFGIGTFFGVHVRMYWAAALVMPLLMLSWVAPGTGTSAEAVLLAAILFVGLFVVIWTHEMGHIVAGRRSGIDTSLITLGPLGGVAHMHAPAGSPRQDLAISLSGPLVHLLWLAVIWPLGWLLPDRVLTLAGWSTCPIVFAVEYLAGLNVGLLLFNLLPIFPLDGGRALRALLAMRWHPNLATMWAGTIGIVGGAGMMLYALVFVPTGYRSTVLFVIGLSCILASIQERRMARHVLVYQRAHRQPWESDPDAWRRGAPSVGAVPRRLGWFAQWRADRAAQKARARADEAAALEREVDEILDRVHRVGMTGLSDREKAVLKRASARRRGAG